MNSYYVYILTNKNKTVLYVGFTDDVNRRTEEHRKKVYNGFTKYYNVDKLVYYEKHLTIEEAKIQEKRIKKWNRAWKENLINNSNPEWKDLSIDFKKLTSLDIMELLTN